MKLLLALSLLLVGCTSAQKDESPAPPRLPGWAVECHKMTSVEGADYCAHSKGTPAKTIWYFHGLACNQDILQDAGSCVIKKEGLAEKAFMAGLDNVTVITVSFGEAWMLDPLHPKLRADKDATVKNFMEKIIPEIKDRHALPKPWQAVGHSMGGANLATLALSEPGLFERVVLAHPMLITCDPWTPVVGLKCVGGIVFLGAEFEKEKWAKVNPIVRIKSQMVFPPTLILVADNDDFGLIAGPKLFGELAKARGLPVRVEAYGGKSHYEYDAAKVLDFLR
jgi:S-formylglutathione hydrolase FrmB